MASREELLNIRPAGKRRFVPRARWMGGEGAGDAGVAGATGGTRSGSDGAPHRRPTVSGGLAPMRIVGPENEGRPPSDPDDLSEDAFFDMLLALARDFANYWDQVGDPEPAAMTIAARMFKRWCAARASIRLDSLKGLVSDAVRDECRRAARRTAARHETQFHYVAVRGDVGAKEDGVPTLYSNASADGDLLERERNHVMDLLVEDLGHPRSTLVQLKRFNPKISNADLGRAAGVPVGSVDYYLKQACKELSRTMAAFRSGEPLPETIAAKLCRRRAEAE